MTVFQRVKIPLKYIMKVVNSVILEPVCIEFDFYSHRWLCELYGKISMGDRETVSTENIENGAGRILFLLNRPSMTRNIDKYINSTTDSAGCIELTQPVALV